MSYLLLIPSGIRRQFKRKPQAHRPVSNFVTQKTTDTRVVRHETKVSSSNCEVSVTVICAGMDMPDAFMDVIDEWMRQHTSQGLFSYERGGVNGNGHAQGIVRTNGIVPARVTSMLKLHLSWARRQGLDNQLIKSIGVQSKRLSGQGIHTWLGMVGYCTKDIKLPHFMCKMFNISQQELESGRMEYIMRGAGPLKKRVALSPHTLLPKVILMQIF